MQVPRTSETQEIKYVVITIITRAFLVSEAMSGLSDGSEQRCENTHVRSDPSARPRGLKWADFMCLWDDEVKAERKQFWWACFILRWIKITMIITSKLPFLKRVKHFTSHFSPAWQLNMVSKGGFSSRDAWTTSVCRSKTPPRVAVSLYIDEVGFVRKTWNGT